MSEQTSLSVLAARIDSLERQARTFKRLFILSLAAGLTFATAAGTIAQQRVLNFTGASSSVRIDNTGLVLFGSGHKKRLSLGFDTGDPAIYIYDANGMTRLGMYISDKGNPVIHFKDRKGKDRIYLGIQGTNEVPRVEFDDGGGNQRLYVGLTGQQDSLVQMLTSAGKETVRFQGTNDDNGTYIRFRDSSSTERVYLGLSTSQEPAIQAFDSSHNKRGFFGEYSDGKFGAYFADADGTTTWSSP